MIIIEKYGITLVSLTEEHLELVRQWRNSPEVSQYMQYKEEITAEMQKDWFKSIDNDHNVYNVAFLDEHPIGLANIKDIDYSVMSAEGGIFIADTDYWGTDIPVRVSLCGLDWCFEMKGLQRIYITASRHNRPALRYNRALGYELLEGEEEKEFQRYVLTPERYYQHRTALLELLVEDE